MAGLSATRPAPELPAEPRLALVVATTSYRDPALRQLRAPARDATDLAELLANPDVGGFVVTSVVDRSAQEIRLAVEDFLTDRGTGDLLVVYLSCHGLIDARRRLYFAAADTVRSRLAATGVEAQWLLEQMEDCRARRQVVILDCCFSGAFAHGAKGEADLGLSERFSGQGRGRVVLTASRATEYSFEGEPVPGSAPVGSVFTAALVEGIRTGAADADNDGYVSVDEAYAYAFDQVQASGAAQTPQRWLYGAEGSILLARSPAGVAITPAPLPEAVRAGLDSPYPAIRRGAVTALGEWLADPDPARTLAARQALQQVADTEIPQLAAAAHALLGPSSSDPSSSPVRPQRTPRLAPAPAAPAGTPAARRSRRGSRLIPRNVRSRIALAVGMTLLIASTIITVFLRPSPPSQPSSTAARSPTGLVTSLLPALRGHTSSVRSVAFSPNGAILASGSTSDDTTVRRWNPATGQPIGQPLNGDAGSVWSVAFNPAGTILATGSFSGIVRQWNPTTGELVGQPLNAHAGSVWSVAFNLAGTILATGNNDGTVRRWNPTTGKQIGQPLNGHNDIVYTVAFSPDGTILASGSADGPVLLWNPTTGKQIGQPLDANAGTVTSVAFNPAGTILASGSKYGTVRLWNPTTGKQIGQPLDANAGTVTSVAFNPTGTILATGNGDGTVRLWNPTTGKQIGQPLDADAGKVNSVAFNPTGTLLAAGNEDSTVRLWRITEPSR